LAARSAVDRAAVIALFYYVERVTGPRWLRGRPLDERELSKRGISAAEELGRDDPLWPGQLAILAALVLYFVLPPKLTIGPNWIVPSAELLVLAALVAATPRRGRTRRRRRVIALTVVLVATLANLVAVGLLTHYLITGGHARGADLINGGLLIWCTNTLLFAVWFWELDRGGPVPPRDGEPPLAPDFLFPQMTDAKYAEPGWKPRFSDYLYVSLTNQTAFSPTDTMPLTTRAKLLMGVQGVASLITVGIIVARAVNILA
jgi:uncharacterized membrane protein